ADEGRLPGPVRTEQREEVAALDLEVDAAQRLHAVAVGLGQSPYRKCIHPTRIGARGRERKGPARTAAPALVQPVLWSRPPERRAHSHPEVEHAEAEHGGQRAHQGLGRPTPTKPPPPGSPPAARPAGRARAPLLPRRFPPRRPATPRTDPSPAVCVRVHSDRSQRRGNPRWPRALPGG